MMKKKISMLTLALVSVTFVGCSTLMTNDPYTLEKKPKNTLVGGVLGGAMGYVVDGPRGLLVGGAIGSGAGYYMDQQEKDLRARLNDAGIEVSLSDAGAPLLSIERMTRFPSGGFHVSDQDIERMRVIAKALNHEKFKDVKLEIHGHADNVGAEEPNEILSEQRADAIAAFLVLNGVSDDRMVVRGYGERRPIASNKTEDGKAQNRRAEIRVLREKPAPVKVTKQKTDNGKVKGTILFSR